MSSYLLAPSLLAADFTRLGSCIEQAREAGADYLHLDVMDGRFVPNISFGPAVVAAARSVTPLPLDVHLMIVEPERYVDAFAAAGADVITVHAEATTHLHRLLQQIRELGARVGLAVNPLTPLTVVEGALPYLDLVLVMSVNPGFGGQSFIASQLRKIEAVRKMIDKSGRAIRLEVDGGINPETARQCVAAGADVLVAGSATFAGGPDRYAANIAALRGAG